MSGPTQITIDSNINDISLDITNNIIDVVDNNCPTEIAITQPTTRVIQVATPGAQGAVGPQGPVTNYIAISNVTASVAPDGDIFTVTSASTDIFSINYQGVVLLQENIIAPTAIRGGIFFSGSGDFYFGS
tara:strand:- start:1196 stop:1585 length:390 start_codon:yes stop_codon:yes gene_type:complete